MRRVRKTVWGRRAVATTAGCCVVALAAGCGGGSGGKKFANNPRPPVPTELTGVITDDEVTISPDVLPLKATKGSVESSTDLPTPIRLTISNQSGKAHPVKLTGKTRDGTEVTANVGPINPLDTGEIQQTLEPGTYRIEAGNTSAVKASEEIRPATLTVNTNRQTSSDTLLLP
jgi:hypothetical protein